MVSFKKSKIMMWELMKQVINLSTIFQLPLFLSVKMAHNAGFDASRSSCGYVEAGFIYIPCFFCEIEPDDIIC